MECDQPTVMGIRIEFDSWIPTVMGKCDSWIPTVMGKCDSWIPTVMGINQLTCSSCSSCSSVLKFLSSNRPLCTTDSLYL